MITLIPHNHTWSYIDGPEDAILLARDYFVFEPANAKWKQNRHWDGKIRLVNHNGKFHTGLAERVNKFFNENGYECKIEYLLPKLNFNAKKLIEHLELKHVPHDFQEESLQYAINNHRATFLSPTASGKSLMIYSLARFHALQKRKVLVMTSRIHLVEQMKTDFIDYNPNIKIEEKIQTIYQGQTKVITKPITISTHQSLDEFSPDFFNKFDVIIVDECHEMTAKTIKGILEKSTDVGYRFGFTGTLDGTECHRLIIEGLTGPVKQVTTIMELVDRKIISDLLVKCVILKWKDHPNFKTYQEEMQWLYLSKRRNSFIAELTENNQNNTLVLSQTLNQIKELHTIILSKTKKRVFIVTGAVPIEEREIIRKEAEKNNGVIILATYGCYQLGVNICNLQNIIFASSSKSQIRVLQSIGRGLRKDNKFNNLTVYDLIDVTQYSKNIFLERIKIYIKEQLPYIQKMIDI